MFGKSRIAILAVSFIGLLGVSTALTYGEIAAKPKIVGNKTCPVTGEKNSKISQVTYEYKGKVYSFCCKACIDEFKKNPEKYIQKMRQ